MQQDSELLGDHTFFVPTAANVEGMRVLAFPGGCISLATVHISHPLFLLYLHFVGFFPRCLPPEWDSVWDRLRSWHIERHRRVGRGLEQCLSGQGGGTSMSGETDPGRANNLTTPLCLAAYLRFFFLVNWLWRSLSLSRASAFRPQPATIPISSLPPWYCALRTMLLWY